MGKGGGSKVEIGPLEKQQARILKTTEKQLGAPMREVISPEILKTLGGGGVFQTSLPGVDRDVIEQQFRQARSNLLETSPTRGGAMASQLADLNRARAFDVASATADARQRGIERALSIVPAFLPGTQQLGQAVGGERQRLLTQAQNQQANQAAAGQGMGQLASMIAMMAMSRGGSKSSREFKEDIQPVSDVRCLLNAVDEMPLYTYRYKPAFHDKREHIGPVVEEAPAIIVDGKMLVHQDCIGLLLGAVKALSAEVKELKAQAGGK